MSAVDKEDADREEASRIASLLARMPEAHTTATTAVVRYLLLSTDGQVFCGGLLREIKTKRLGAGVLKVWTAASPSGDGEGR